MYQNDIISIGLYNLIVIHLFNFCILKDKMTANFKLQVKIGIWHKRSVHV